MKTVTLEVRSPDEGMRGVRANLEVREGPAVCAYWIRAPELLWKVLSAKRWELLKALCGAGPVSIREAARRVQRDVKAVHSDVTALLSAGLLNRTETGNIEFPYEAIKVEFLLHAA